MKLGAVEYLNAEPLVWPLEHGIIEHDHEIIRAVPSELVIMLENGDVDCALAPVAALLDNQKLVPVPDVAIATRGAIASVLVFHNGPFDKLTTIWLDPSSRTSNLLVKVLRDRAAVEPCEFPLVSRDEIPPFINLPENTGRLIIGDYALRLGAKGEPGFEVTDLGELWRAKTNHPFTFARWIARNGDIAGELKDVLKAARDWSMLNMHEIIGPLALKHDFSEELVDRYLRVNVVYMHGPREQAGEREFLILAGNLKNK